MDQLEILKQEAEKAFPLPDSKYIEVSGGLMDCGAKSRALAFTFVRRTDYINGKLKEQMALRSLRRLVRSLDVEQMVGDFPEAIEEARDILEEGGMPSVIHHDKEMLARAAALGIHEYTNAQRYGDYPQGCFTMELDFSKAKIIEQVCDLETGNAPHEYGIDEINAEAQEKRHGMSVWADYDDDEMFIEIKAIDIGGYNMVLGTGRLPSIVEFLEKLEEHKLAKP